MTSFRKLAYAFYAIVRWAVRATGLIGPVRKVAGPTVGRLLFKFSSGKDGFALVQGHKMYLASQGSYPPVDMLVDRYEPQTTAVLKDIVKPGMVVVDIGAHVGYYTLLAAQLVGTAGKVYAFEPEDNNHALLEKNIASNVYQNIVLTKSAISDRIGGTTLYLTALDSGRHSMYHHDLPEQGALTVATTTLDYFFASEKWPRIDLIKIDVEGAEASVLNGMIKLLERSTGLKLIIEFNPRLLQDAGVIPIQFLERLTNLEWEVRLIDEDRGLQPLSPEDSPPLIDRLLASGISSNLYCAP